jgi:tripartite-type tricarboxylate transporter receptor subunit TctC
MPKSRSIVAQKSFKSRRLKARLIAAAAAVFLFGAGSSTGSHAQTPYYQGKTITLVVGTVAGDLYDLYARAFAQYMPKHIPGNPNMIVQNMPGAGHMIAANYLYSVAKPDGLTIGATLPTLYFEQLIGRAEVKFDFSKFNWLGNATKSPSKIYKTPKRRPNAAPQERATWATSCPSFWRRPLAPSSTSLPAIPAAAK